MFSESSSSCSRPNMLPRSFNGKRSLICEIWNVPPSLTWNLSLDDDDENGKQEETTAQRATRRRWNKSTIAARTSIFLIFAHEEPSAALTGRVGWNLSMLQRRRMGRRREVAHEKQQKKSNKTVAEDLRRTRRKVVVKSENPPWSNHHNFELYLFLVL